MKKRITILGVSALALMSATANAATTSTATASHFTDNLKASFSTTFIGSGLTSPLSSKLPDEATGELSNDPKAAILLKNKLYAGYKLNNDVAVGPVFYWKHFAREQQMVLQDCYIKLNDNNLFKTGNFSIYGEVLVSGPTSQASRDANLITTINPSLNPSFTIPNSRFSLSVWSSMEVKLYSSNWVGKKGVTFYAGPQVEYKINDKVSAWLLYEAKTKHVVGKGFQLDFTDLEPGLNWDITPRISFQPFLDIKIGTPGNINLTTTSINAYLNFKLL